MFRCRMSEDALMQAFLLAPAVSVAVATNGGASSDGCLQECGRGLPFGNLVKLVNSISESLLQS